MICYNEIRLCAMILFTILESIVNIVGEEGLCDHLKRDIHHFDPHVGRSASKELLHILKINQERGGYKV